MAKNSLILNNCIIEEEKGRACSLNQFIYTNTQKQVRICTTTLIEK